MRRLNLVFLAILLAAAALLGGGLHLVHGYQVRRNASALLDRARRAEADHQLEKAEQALRQYLNLEREDARTWQWYARLVAEADPEGRRRHHVFLVHEEALRHNPDDSRLRHRCAELALELGQYNDAKSHLTDLLKEQEKDSQDRPADARAATEQAELKDLLGQCERGLAQYEAAGGHFREALKLDKHRVDTYDRLARLLRVELGQIGKADSEIAEMMVQNPGVGRAYIYRWRYKQTFAPPAMASDIKTALKLAPDDSEVLATAALAAVLKPDEAAARAHFEKGCRLYPKNPGFALGLARLEIRAGHPERAEAVLRQAYQASFSLEVAFELAEILISQGKLEGEGQAGAYMDRLRAAGLGDTVVRFLEAEALVQQALVQQEKMPQAVAALETARAVLGAHPRLRTRVNLLLADCYGKLEKDELRLDALREAAQDGSGPEVAGLALVQTLARSGKLDQAVTVLLPLADRRPEWRLDLVRLLIQRAIRQPRDQRDWVEVQRQLAAAEEDLTKKDLKALPQADERLVLLHLDVLAAQDRLKEARALLDQALAREPRNLRYRLALAGLTQREGQGEKALRIIDQAEHDLGKSPELRLARLDYWGREGGPAARAALAQLAASRQQVPAAERPALLSQLGTVALRLGELALARQSWRELAGLKTADLPVRLGLFDLALVAGDRDEAARLVDEIRHLEGEEGNSWRFARASLLLDRASRGAARDQDEARRDLEEARRLAEEIKKQRPDWWVGPTLDGEIAELTNDPNTAINHYLSALEKGNIKPLFARRLVGLLNQRNDPGDREKIDHVTHVLRGQGAALAEVAPLAQALEAVRRRNFYKAIELARQVYHETSKNASDHLNLGRFYAAAGWSKEAGEHYQNAVRLGRGIPQVWLTYVQHLVQNKQIARAQQVVEDARQALPPNQATTWTTLAQCFQLLGDTRQVEAMVRKALDTAGEAADPAPLRLAVAFYLGQNRIGEAEKYLGQLEQREGASPADKAWVNRTRATALLAQGRPADRDRALALVGRNLAADPESVEDQSLKANILALRPDRRGEAIAILERLAGANRLGVNEHFLLARLYLEQRDEEKYRGEMLKLLGLGVKDPRHLAHFVNYCIGRGQLDEAGRRLAELKTAEPKGMAALELEARLLDLRQRKPELKALLEARGREVPDQIGSVADLLNRYGFAKEAEAAYKASIAREPRQPERTLALAQFLARQDRVPEAMEVLKKAWTTCRPEQVVPAALMVFAASSAGPAERRQVEAWVAEVVRQRPEAVLMASKLGVIQIHQGRFDEAEGLFRRLLAGQPDNPDVLNNLAWLLALRDRGKAQEALELINRAIDIRGADPSLVDTRAVVLIRAGQYDRAIQEIRNAQAIEPENPSLAIHLAWAFQAKGQTEEARKQFLRAEEFGRKIQGFDPLERAITQKLRHELFPG
jgi:tetratricopeptide (TPR) repeat protein